MWHKSDPSHQTVSHIVSYDRVLALIVADLKLPEGEYWVESIEPVKARGRLGSVHVAGRHELDLCRGDGMTLDTSEADRVWE